MIQSHLTCRSFCIKHKTPRLTTHGIAHRTSSVPAVHVGPRTRATSLAIYSDDTDIYAASRAEDIVYKRLQLGTLSTCIFLDKPLPLYFSSQNSSLPSHCILSLFFRFSRFGNYIYGNVRLDIVL